MADSQISVLMKLAHDDAAAFEVLSEQTRLHALAGFHAQQAVEKSMKAVLLLRTADFPFTHNLGLLWDLCTQHDLVCPISKFDVTQLTPYAVEGRYDELVEGVSIEKLKSTIESALAWAQQTINAQSQINF
jgi:HEPN domain-containing protein